MATIPPTRGRRRRATAHEAQQSKAKSASSSTLPSWCSGFRKESLDSERAYDERVTTSTKTSEIRLRQESVRYWNRFLEEAEAAAFGKIVAPTCHQIQDILFSQFGGDGEDFGENQKNFGDRKIEKQSEGEDRGIKNDDSIELDGGNKRVNGDDDGSGENDDDSTTRGGGGGDVDDDWEYCRQMFGLPSASTAAPTPTPTRTNEEEKSKTPSTPSKLKSFSLSAQTPWDQKSVRIRYPFEVLPIFVITSPLISNCLQDRSKICHSMWRQLNGLECTIGAQQSFSSGNCGDDGEKRVFINNSPDDHRSVCLYLPRLLSSLTETLQVIWDGLLSHYENTHDAPSMDPDDPHYYSNPNDLASKRHSYHVSKRRHYESLVDRKVTTESQKSKIGTKKQQSLQDFILEFLQYIYEEPEWNDQKCKNSSTPDTKTENENGHSKRNQRRLGNLILLLEDPRIVHPKVATVAGQGVASSASGKPNNNNLVQSQFLETLTAWREMYGIPVSLVVFHSVGSTHEIQQDNVLLNPSFESSANGGRFGMKISRCSIPSTLVASIGTSIPTSMAFGLWSQYFLQATMNNPLPLLAPQRYHCQHNNKSSVTEIILRMYREAFQNESSCSKWVSSIRARITLNFYALKGSFVWDALNPNTAAMIRKTPLHLETDVNDRRNIMNDNNTNSNSGIDKDRKSFAIGNDDVQIFQPEFVAWFCSYHKAHTLLSSRAGDQKAEMILSEKCEALLKCYELLRPPLETKEENDLQGKPSKRRKFCDGDYRNTDSQSGGILQFWWSISCSLLPLYFLSLTVANEGVILSSIAASPDRSTANGSTKRNDLIVKGEYMWVLERLTEVYNQLSIDDYDRNFDFKTTISDEIWGKASISPNGHISDSVPTESTRESSENNRGSYHDRGRHRDFVEATLKRYLQRGIEEGANYTTGNRDILAASFDATAIEEVHQQGIRKLTTMVQEFIVLIAELSTSQKRSSTGNKEGDITRDDKIRLGMTETILEMNLLALGQVEAWTLQWIEFNPLMAASSSEEVNELSSIESRPVNFRRRILDNLPVGSRQLYQALEGRLSIDREDWYHSFGGTIEDFAVGVWTLRKSGLIRPKKTIAATKSKKSQEVISYEKVAVVWC